VQTNTPGTGLVNDTNAWHAVSGSEITNRFVAPLNPDSAGLFFRLSLP
jgi:hypothetical protein